MPHKLLSNSITAILLFTSLLFSAATQAQWFSDFATELQLNDNLSRSGHNGAEDTAISVALAAGYHWQTSDYTALNLLGSIQQTRWNTYSGMNNLDSGLSLNVRHKFGIGENKPVLNFSTAYNLQNFHNNIRDASVFSNSLSLSKRFTDTLQLTLGASYEKNDGDHDLAIPPAGAVWNNKFGKVWDYSAWTLSLQAELDLGPLSWLSGGFSYRNGDVVSTGINYTQVNTAAFARTYDPVFGPHAVSYRLDARTRLFSVDYNHALFEASTWYAGTEYQYSTASNGIPYKTSLLRTGFIHSF